MKFGRKYALQSASRPGASSLTNRSLPRNQVPEWAASYINYKGLKKLVKAAAETAKSGETVDLAGRTSQAPYLGREPVP